MERNKCEGKSHGDVIFRMSQETLSILDNGIVMHSNYQDRFAVVKK